MATSLSFPAPRPLTPRRFARPLHALWLVLACLLTGAPALRAATINVPADQLTIQAAVNAASSGDTIILADGTYSGSGNRDIDTGGKNLTIYSLHGPASAVIDCGGSSNADHRGFYIHTGELVSLINLSIKNGYENGSTLSGGGAINVDGDGQIYLQSCIFSGNAARSGGAIYINGPSALVNSHSSTANAYNCVFYGNSVLPASGGGAVPPNAACLYSAGLATTFFVNCTMAKNSLNAIYIDGGTATLTNMLMYDDVTTNGQEAFNNGSQSTLTQNNSYSYTHEFATSANSPKFVSATDFHLQPGSPCLAAGRHGDAPPTDLDGITRPNPPSVGAYELPVTRNVPSADYPTIQSAVDAAASGETVLVADGTYTGTGNVDIDFGGKNITVTSVNGAASTIIDCQGTDSAYHRGFYIHSGETSAVISGFTIKNGNQTGYQKDDGYGGGVCITNNSGAAVENCTLSGNAAGNGGGIFCYNAGSNTSSIINCLVSGNTTQLGGGGIFSSVNDGSVAILNCTVTGNTDVSDNGGGISDTNIGSGTGAVTVTNCLVSGNTGGGIISYSDSNGPIMVTNCTVSGNTSATGGISGGITNENVSTSDSYTGTITVTNCISYGNTSLNDGDVEDTGSDPVSVVNYCDISGGYTGTGNINADPLFVSATDFHLQAASPCLGAGTSAGAPTDTLDGQTRAVPPAIGAYELGTVTPAGPGHVHLLWTNTNGMASIWTVNPDGTFTSTVGYGPITNWHAAAIADAQDGKTRMLWKRNDGMVSVWTVNTQDSSYISTPGYGPISGWDATSLAVGPGSATRLRWTRAADLMSSVWTLDLFDPSFVSTPGYGPYSGWTAAGLAVDAADATRLLWTNPNGRFSVWSVDSAGSITSTPAFGPIAGWGPTKIAAGPDANARLLLNRTDGQMAVWTVSASTGSFTSTPGYGPIAGWTCRDLAVGIDGKTHVLWTRSDAMNSVWTISSDGSLVSTPGYGPYAGWSVAAIAAGP